MDAGEPTQVEGLIPQCPFCLLCCLIKSIIHCHVLLIYRCNLTKDRQTDELKVFWAFDSILKNLKLSSGSTVRATESNKCMHLLFKYCEVNSIQFISRNKVLTSCQ